MTLEELDRWLEADGEAATGNKGIFLVTLDDNSLCTDFREWWNSRTRPA